MTLKYATASRARHVTFPRVTMGRSILSSLYTLGRGSQVVRGNQVGTG